MSEVSNISSSIDKRCARCGTVRPLGEFGKSANRPDGLRGECRPCQQSYMAAWRARNRERMRDHQRAYNARRTPEQLEAKRQQDLARYHADPLAPRDRYLRRTYGITQEQYNSLLASQAGGCAICGGDNGDRLLAVDHDHACCSGAKSCGECVRGLLCSSCNNGLGRFRDNTALLLRAVAYLDNH